LAGVFGHRLFEFRGGLRLVQAARASFDDRPASRVAQETSGSWGAFLLVTYSLGKQRKVTRRKGEKQPNNQPQNPRGHECPPYSCETALSGTAISGDCSECDIVAGIEFGLGSFGRAAG